MNSHFPIRPASLIFGVPIFLAAVMIYMNFRQEVFSALAAGTEWVLVTCGFVPENGGKAIENDRLRNLYYAARMFNETPPKELSPEDQLAAERFPGMGFGLVHTFDHRPVSTVIGGWLFSIPCTYFIDSRDCKQVPAAARLKVSVNDFAPMTLETVEQFLSAASTEVLRITISSAPGGELWPKDLQSDTAYTTYSPAGDTTTAIGETMIRCLRSEHAREMGVMPHCLARFKHNADTLVELMYSENYREDSADIIAGSRQLVNEFQVKTQG